MNELHCTAEEAAWKSEATALSESLVALKLYASDGLWTLTPEGREELCRLHQEVAGSFPVKVSYGAIEYAESVFLFV